LWSALIQRGRRPPEYVVVLRAAQELRARNARIQIFLAGQPVPRNRDPQTRLSARSKTAKPSPDHDQAAAHRPVVPSAIPPGADAQCTSRGFGWSDSAVSPSR